MSENVHGLIDKLAAADAAIKAADDWAGEVSIGRQKHIYDAVMAIQEVESEDDLVSRQTVIDLMNGLPKWLDNKNHVFTLDFGDVMSALYDKEKLPSIPQYKKDITGCGTSFKIRSLNSSGECHILGDNNGDCIWLCEECPINPDMYDDD